MTQEQWRTQILPLQPNISVRSSWEGQAKTFSASLCRTSLWQRQASTLSTSCFLTVQPEKQLGAPPRALTRPAMRDFGMVSARWSSQLSSPCKARRYGPHFHASITVQITPARPHLSPLPSCGQDAGPRQYSSFSLIFYRNTASDQSVSDVAFRM